ncbi:MAG: serine hydroxymethyltransferase [Candidatus Micrarchaeia archaeon]
MKSIDDIRRVVDENETWRNSTLNLIASENIMFPEVPREFYCNDFMHRYAEGKPYQRYYNGTKFIDELESACEQHFREHFKCHYADVRPISGAIANLAVFSGLPHITGKIVSNSLPSGGHITHNRMGTISKICKKEVHNFVVDEDNPFKTDVDRSIRIIRDTNPDFIVLGKSMFLHPEPVREIRNEFPELVIVYDAAHVFGLIYGGEFQAPFSDGADIITASTHKTFPGPQGGIILIKEEMQFEKGIDTALFPGILSNHHLHRIPALLATAIAYDTAHRDYGKRVIGTAQKLAKMMAESGYNVCGYDGKEYTYTHQVVVDVSAIGGGAAVADKLEKNNIIVNKNSLPWDTSVIAPSGIRIGVQEAVLRGIGAEEIFEKIDRALKKQK